MNGKACISRLTLGKTTPHFAQVPTCSWALTSPKTGSTWFDAALLSSQSLKPGHKRFPNSTSGFEQLIAWLKNRKAGPVHACPFTLA